MRVGIDLQDRITVGVEGGHCLKISKGDCRDPGTPPRPVQGLGHIESGKGRRLFLAPLGSGSSQNAGGKRKDMCLFT